jgi:hypothetical protein
MRPLRHPNGENTVTTAKLPRDILRREYVFFLLATGAVYLHFLDDNVLQPNTSGA